MMKGQTQFDGSLQWRLMLDHVLYFSILPTVVNTANVHLHVKPTHASLITARQDKRQDAHNISESGDCSSGSKVLAWKQNSD